VAGWSFRRTGPDPPRKPAPGAALRLMRQPANAVDRNAIAVRQPSGATAPRAHHIPTAAPAQTDAANPDGSSRTD
jgi:hypothetical protein